MQIFEQLLFTTLRIVMLDAGGNPTGVGTGFLLSRPVGNNQYKIYLISNKHVLCKTESISIAFTKKEDDRPKFGDIINFPIKGLQGNVYEHPDPSVDIAALD